MFLFYGMCVLGACMCVYIRVYVALFMWHVDACMHVCEYVCVWCMHMKLDMDFNILSYPPQFFSFSFFDFMCMNILIFCLQVYMCTRFPRVKSYMWLESRCGCWEFNLGSLQEQQAVFTAFQVIF